jgi:hypothetical protein
MVIKDSFPITKIKVTSTEQENPPYTIVFASNRKLNNFAWGAQCSPGTTTNVDNFPILMSGTENPDIGYLQIYCASGQYQVYWDIGGEGIPGQPVSATVMMQQVGYTGSYLQAMTNITPAGGLTVGDYTNLQLNIDMNPTSGETGISLTKL